MALTSGQRLGAYEITSSLGSGGMGEVYRARDSRLGRDVALKVLPPDVTNEPGRLERFDREARAIAALNHPHIVTIYSTEDAGGIRFLTMELVDGCTLGDLIVSSGMAIPKFLEIALPLADALAAAHQKQITHRDLKPGNVMVSNDGRVKVLDFGLARVGGATAGEQTLIATQAPITHQGMIVGTMPYMSPEQVEGRPLDPRTDLFSLGVIFYELLSGTRPFAGSSSPALMSAILRDTPSSIRDKRPEVPEALDRLISRMLEKRPEDRVQTARDVFNEIRLIKGSEGSTGVQRRFSERSTVENLRIAVLPFIVRGGDPDAQAMAAGLTDDIAASLARFAGLAVVASQSTRAFTDSPLDVREIAARLGARYVVGGTVRKSGNAIRTTSQLIDAESGAQLWSETYDRRLEGNTDLFAIQDDVVDHIVATLADQGGVLAQSMMRSVQSTSVGESTAAQLIVRMWAFQHEASPQRHAELRARIERELESAPDSADLWALLANLYICEHSLMYNPLPDPLGRALRAALRAIELDRSNQPGWLWLGLVHFHRHDRAGLEEAFDRATRINPRNAYVMAWAGNILTHVGEYQRGTQLTARAMQINPAHPGWVHFSVFNRHFAEGNFEAALQAARRVNVPTFFWMHFAIASAAGHLGRFDEGRQAAEAMLSMQPAFADEANLREFITRWYWPEEMIESLLEGVGRAGDRPSERSSERSSEPPSERSSERPSSNSGADSTFMISLTPFKAAGGETAASLADGLTQGIAVALSRFPYLRVITRAAADARVSTGYALQGSVRASGDVLRVVVQLTEAGTGASIWGQSYDRDLRTAPLFQTQDALTDTIVATMADPSGALVRTMTSVVRSKPVDALTPYEAVMRRFAYVSVISSAEHALVRDALERAVTIAPAYATAWASLAGIYVEEFAQGYNPKPEPLQRARAAAHRALELDSMHPFAHASLALVHFFQKDFAAFRAARDLALAANPLDTGVLAYLGALTAYSGDWEAGLAMSERAMALNPQYPGIYRMPVILDLYRRREYSAALELLSRLNLPNYPNSLIIRAALYGQLGRIDEGRTLVRDAEAMSPGISHPESDARRKWVPAALVDHIQQGLDKLSASSDASHESSIAVMPFVDLSAQKDQDWFCDGIAEELLNALAPLPGLRVAARASAFSLRGKTDDLRSIGEKLNVKTVLEGSVRRAGDRVRITVQLSDAREGRQIWSERFDREMRDIFDVQEEIARAIVERLRVTLAAGGPERLVQQTTTNIEAYQLLLQGRTFVTRRGRAILEAIPCFERAIELDPNLSEAHALLGDAYRLLGLYGIARASEVMPKARAYSERALSIDPTQPEALATVAIIASIYEWDIDEVYRRSDRALAADPMHVRALAERAISLACLYSTGTSWHQEVLDQIAKARALDPLNAWVMAIEGFIQMLVGRGDDAIATAKHAIELDAGNFTAHWIYSSALAQFGREDEALEASIPALAMSGRHTMILTTMAAIYSERGEIDKVEAIREELIERAKTGFISYGAQASVAAAAGRWPEARQLLAKATAEHDPFVTFWKLRGWQPIWKDEQCAALIRATSLFHRSGA